MGAHQWPKWPFSPNINLIGKTKKSVLVKLPILAVGLKLREWILETDQPKISLESYEMGETIDSP